MILKPFARVRATPEKIGISTSILLGCATFLVALLLTGSLRSAVFCCACCGAVICTTDIALRMRAGWRKQQGERAPDAAITITRSGQHACGKPEHTGLSADDRNAWLGIVLRNYTNEELDSYTRRGEQLRANRGRR